MEPHYSQPNYNSGPEPNWFDKQALGYADWMFYFHLFCCSCPGLIVALVLLAGCQTQEGKNKATKLLALSALGIVFGMVIRVLIQAAKH